LPGRFQVTGTDDKVTVTIFPQKDFICGGVQVRT